ncbi:MAG TPA: sensor histidine kinase [Trebonia sp.]|nr:sensor histidine kinase [Trebonia sp.]
MTVPANPDPVPGGYWSPHPYRTFILGRFAPGTGLAGQWRRIFPSIWLVYLIPLAAGGFGHRHDAMLVAAGVAVGLAFGAIYVGVVGWWWDSPPHLALAGLALLAGLATLAYFVFGKEAVWLWIYVAVAAGIAVNSQWLAMRAIAGTAACYSAFSLSAHSGTGDFLSGLLPLLLGGLAALGFRGRFELTKELRQAQQTVALLAASEERLRLARDMHDLTGQSLSTITLKSDLTVRVLDRLPASPERDRAREEVQQIADVSRQALRDVREALSGYRRPTLAVEAITARAALEAAGIAAHDDTALTVALSPGSASCPDSGSAPGPAPGPACTPGAGADEPDGAANGPTGQAGSCSDSEAALAWCLREAVTNVVRHSGARNCWLTLRRTDGTFTLEVRDDGRGLPGAPAATTPEVIGARGDHSGLHGMSERLAAVGGRLEIQPSGGFRLIATVPARRGASVAR